VDAAESPPESPAGESSISAAAVPRRLYYGYWLLSAGFVAQFVAIGSQSYIFGAFLNPMTEELDWTRSEYTLARTIGQFAMAAAGLYVGGHVDRHGGRRLMQVGAVLLAAALLGCSLVQELWQWWLLNGLALTAGAAMIGNLVVNVTLAKWFVEKRGRVIGVAAMGVSFAGVVLTPLTTVLIDAVGWRDAWRVLAFAAVAIVLPLSLLMRRTPEDHGLHPDGRSTEEVARGAGEVAARDFASSLTRREAMQTRAFYMLVAAFALGALSIVVMLVQTIPYMTDAGYSRGVAALMVSLTSVPSLLSKPVWGYLVESIDARKLAATGFALNAASLLLIVLSVRAGATPLIFLGFFTLGLGWGGLIPLQEVIWASFFGRRYLGSVRSAGMPFTLTLGAAAPFGASVYFDSVGDYNGALLAIAGAAVVATILVLVIPSPTAGAEARRGALPEAPPPV
jgi:MFS family permease